MTKEEILNSSPSERSIEGVDSLSRRLFGDLIDFDAPVTGMGEGIVLANNFKEMLQDNNNTLVTLEEKGEVIGFTLATPIDTIDKGREAESSQTAYGFLGGIEPSHQWEGLIGIILKKLVQQLRDQGYSFIECDCTIYNGWADSVKRFYEKFDGAIIEEYDRSVWPDEGPYRFFRINLQRVDSSQDSIK